MLKNIVLTCLFFFIFLIISSFSLSQIYAQSSDSCIANPWLTHNIESGYSDHTQSIPPGIAISPDGTKFAIATKNKLALYNAESLSQIVIIDAGRKWDAYHQYDLSWSPDSSKIAVARYIYNPLSPETIDPNSGVQIWDVESTHLLYFIPTETENIAWTPNGNFIVFIDYHGTFNLWNVSDTSIVSTYDTDEIFRQITWSSSGNQIAALTATGQGLYLWSKWDQPPVNSTLTSILSFVDHISWSSDNRQLALTESGADRVQIWDTLLNRVTKTSSDVGSNVFTAEWSPNETQIAIGARNGLFLWNLSENSEVSRTNGTPPEIASIAWMPNGESLFFVDFIGTIYKWSLSAGCLVGELSLE